MAVRIGDSGDRGGRRPEELLVEEPLEIRLGDTLMATTMRTPGHDFELAAGWCWAEGLLDSAPAEVRYCATGSAADTAFNVVTVDPGPAAPAPGAGLSGADGDDDGRVPSARLGLTSSSCGICGVDQVDRLVERLDPLPVPAPPLTAEALVAVGAGVADGQELFAATGGAHAAAAVDAAGGVLLVREDIGRHNAVDKVVGRLLLDGGLPAHGRVLWVSGRASFEVVQKAWAAGFSALVSVSAPSSLAVTTAERAGLVLVGFARGGRATVYAGDALVALPEPLPVPPPPQATP
jgi:FdhD protein